MFKEAVKKIKKAKNVLVIPHIMPDGDSIGSSIALKLALESLGKTACIHNTDPLPEDIAFLGKDHLSDANDFLKSADLIIALDSSDKSRLSMSFESISRLEIINIDHHKTNENYGSLNLVYPEAAATGEIVYKLILAMDIEVDVHMAECLYAAIATDTGRFLYSNTRSETLRIVSGLLDKGIDIDKLNILLYQNNSIEKVRFEAEAILGMEAFYGQKVSVICLGRALFESYNLEHTASDGIVEKARNIKDIQISLLLKEVGDTVKVSMRSKGRYDVSEIAAIFGGGGHRNAAGFVSELPMSAIKEKLLFEVGALYGFKP